MAEKDLLSLKDLLSGGSLKAKLLSLLPELAGKHKEKLIAEIDQGKAVKEVHTKSGLKHEEPHEFDKRECITGLMKLPESGDWTCFALWKSGDKLYQGTFQMKIDPDPQKSGMSLKISSPPGTPATTFTVIDIYFKFDYDANYSPVTVAGEFGVSYVDTKQKVRTLMFTTKPNKVLSV
jgi:hypothetical protein